MSRAGASERLEIRITRKAYAAPDGTRVDVLRDIAFGIGAREVVALVGPSGCGKTTLLRIVAGLDRDFEGEVDRPEAARLGMVFQEPRLLAWRSVEENVRLVAPDLAPERLDALFDALELSAHRGHLPGALSLGLARRAALARAFAVEPALLLLDEPFVSLDLPLARRLRRQLVDLIDARGTATLLVTHDAEEAVSLADRVLLLSPRPATILADIAIATPRRLRSEAEMQQAIAAIDRHREATGGAGGR
ncbi:MAG: ABC transporter ATP-binding protein [Pseudolabrys sp.]